MAKEFLITELKSFINNVENETGSSTPLNEYINQIKRIILHYLQEDEETIYEKI